MKAFVYRFERKLGLVRQENKHCAMNCGGECRT